MGFPRDDRQKLATNARIVLVGRTTDKSTGTLNSL
jgi:hypothetical protein